MDGSKLVCRTRMLCSLSPLPPPLAGVLSSVQLKGIREWHSKHHRFLLLGTLTTTSHYHQPHRHATEQQTFLSSDKLFAVSCDSAGLRRNWGSQRVNKTKEKEGDNRRDRTSPSVVGRRSLCPYKMRIILPFNCTRYRRLGREWKSERRNNVIPAYLLSPSSDH